MFRGTTSEQDPRWDKNERKIFAAMERNGQFSSILETKVSQIRKIDYSFIYLVTCHYHLNYYYYYDYYSEG